MQELSDDEKLIVIIALSVLGIVALGAFLLILLDPYLFRIEDDDDDLTDLPRWIIEQGQPVPMEQVPPRQSTNNTAPQRPPPTSSPPPVPQRPRPALPSPAPAPAPPLLLPPVAEEPEFRIQKVAETASTSQRTTPSTPTVPTGNNQALVPIPPRQVQQKPVSSRVMTVYDEHKDSTSQAIVPIPVERQLEVFQDEQRDQLSDEFNSMVFGPETVGVDATETSAAREDEIPVFATPPPPPPPTTTTSPRANISTGENATVNDGSAVEISSFDPGERSVFTLPEEVKEFEAAATAGKEEEKEQIFPGSFAGQKPNLKAPSQTQSQTPLKYHPSTKSSVPVTPVAAQRQQQYAAAMSVNSVKALIPSYSRKAERQRFIILNALFIVIITCITSVLVVRFYL